MKYVFCRIAVFSVTVFFDERIVIVAEQRPDASEEDSFQWMSRVLQVHFLKQLTIIIFFGLYLQNSSGLSHNIVTFSFSLI